LFWQFCSFARLKIQTTVKACVWRYWVRDFNVDLLSKIVYYVISRPVRLLCDIACEQAL
jgi:hypothetical protein